MPAGLGISKTQPVAAQDTFVRIRIQLPLKTDYKINTRAK